MATSTGSRSEVWNTIASDAMPTALRGHVGICHRQHTAGMAPIEPVSLTSCLRDCDENADGILVLPLAQWLRTGADHWHLSAVRVGEQAGTESRPRLVAGARPRLYGVGCPNSSPRRHL